MSGASRMLPSGREGSLQAVVPKTGQGRAGDVVGSTPHEVT